jgi:hypothetical protein
VEVEFERRAFFGGVTAVRSCSAFERGAPISCRRRCLNASYRSQWEPALPVREARPLELTRFFARPASVPRRAVIEPSSLALIPGVVVLVWALTAANLEVRKRRMGRPAA